MNQTSAPKIEAIIDMVMDLNAGFAEQNRKIQSFEEKLSILNTLKEVNFYMGNALEMDEMVHTLNDVVLGVLGVSASVVGLNFENTRKTTEASVFGKDRVVFDEAILQFLCEKVKETGGQYVACDLSDRSVPGFEYGSLAAYRICRGEVCYGMISVYYEQKDALTESLLEFFFLISTQLGVLLENAFLFQKVSLLSRTDGLTGIYNRAHFNEVLSHPDYREAEDLGVMMVDIDRFKLVNDTYGHLFGDQVIKRLASIMNEAAQKYGLIAFRYGGEEMIMIARGRTMSELKQIAEDIRIRFREAVFETKDGSVQLTASIGVALMGHSTWVVDAMKLVQLADDAMYAAKKEGRNRTVCADGDLVLQLQTQGVLDMMMSRFKRFQKPFMLLKVKIPVDSCHPLKQYEEKIQKVIRQFRLYDFSLFNHVGDVLLVLENPIALDLVKRKLTESGATVVGHLVVETESPDLSSFFQAVS